MKHDQLAGGSFNAHKNWKKLREKHKRNEEARSRGRDVTSTPETHRPYNQTVEGSERIVSKQLYDLNYDLAFGRITPEEYDKLKEALGE